MDVFRRWRRTVFALVLLITAAAVTATAITLAKLTIEAVMTLLD